jgi:hypothetical protein
MQTNKIRGTIDLNFMYHIDDYKDRVLKSSIGPQ